MAEPGSSGGGSYERGDHSPDYPDVPEREKFLPMSNVFRIMKMGIPANGRFSKEAKDMTQECASEFISFVTTE